MPNPTPRPFRRAPHTVEMLRSRIGRMARHRRAPRPLMAELPHTVSFEDRAAPRRASSYELVRALGPRQLPLSILDVDPRRTRR